MKTMTKTDKRSAQDNSQQHAQPQPTATRRFISPRVNITETKDGYLLEAEMPGVGKDGLEISLEGNELTLMGRRALPPQDLELVYRETPVADFRRIFVLDPTVDATKIEAKIENGVLRLHLPKAEQVKPRRIAVN